MTFVELPGAIPSGGVVVPPPLPVAAPRTIRFTGNGRTYLRLWIRGSLLLALTLGIYRFWLATDVRRFLWANTEVNGDSLEYTGTALELVIGFLIGMAILVPLYVGFFVVALNLGPWGAFISVLGFPVLAFLGHFAVYRARRYRLTRTVYRGIRFHQGGSALRYAVCALFWWVLITLTLGLVYPFAQASLERFKMKNTYYGNLRGRFDGSGGRLFVRGVLLWFAVVGPIIAAIIVPLAVIDWRKIGTIVGSGDNPEQIITKLAQANPELAVAAGVSVLLLTLSIMLAVVLFPVFQALVLRWWIDGLRIGALDIASRLRIGTIYVAYLRFIGWSMLYGLAASILFGIGTGVLVLIVKSASIDKELIEILAVVGGVAFYVIFMLGYSIIYQVTVKLTLWRHSVETAILSNVAALDKVSAEGAPSSALGEGLADALNVGGI